jgi:hypothetical protein
MSQEISDKLIVDQTRIAECPERECHPADI